MKQALYSVYDLVAKVYSAPYSAPSDAMAIRSLLTVVRDTNSQLNQHPHDFRLFRLAEWNDEKGEITAELPHLVVNIIDLIPTKELSK